MKRMDRTPAVVRMSHGLLLKVELKELLLLLDEEYRSSTPPACCFPLSSKNKITAEASPIKPAISVITRSASMLRCIPISGRMKMLAAPLMAASSITRVVAHARGSDGALCTTIGTVWRATEAEAAAKFADESPFPTEADIFTDVYSEVDNPTGDGPRGTHFFN